MENIKMISAEEAREMAMGHNNKFVQEHLTEIMNEIEKEAKQGGTWIKHYLRENYATEIATTVGKMLKELGYKIDYNFKHINIIWKVD